MKRWEVNKHLQLNLTDAALRRKLRELDLSLEDGHSFTPDEIEQIRSAYSASSSQQPAASSLHPQNSQAAGQALQQSQQLIQQSTANCLSNVQHYINRTAAQRDQSIERISDTIAYLHDPGIFLAEVLQRAALKSQQPGKLPDSSWELDSGEFPDLLFLPALPGLDVAQLPAC